MSATTSPTASGRKRLRGKLTVSAAATSAAVLISSLFVDMGSPSNQGRWRWTVGATLAAVGLTGAILVLGRRQMRAIFRAPLTGLFYGLLAAIILGGVLVAVEWLMTGGPPAASLRAAVLAGLPAGAIVGVGIGLIAWAVFRLVPHRAPGPDAQRKRPRFQFGLRTLLFAVLVVALLLWVGMPAQRNYEHQRAVSQLIENGARIKFEGEKTEDWLESLAGVRLDRQWYADVQGVALSAGTTDADLRRLEYVPEVRQLMLDCTDLTDAGLAPLQRLRALEALDLFSPRMSGEGLGALASMPQLSAVSVQGGVLSDVAIVYLMSPPKLRSLMLQNATFSGSGLSAVPPTPIKGLNITGVNVTDADLEQLSRFPAIEFLSLSGTSVTDAGLASLGRMQTLRHLNLSGTGLTGQGLAQLSGLRNLQSLTLNAFSIRDQDLSTLSSLTGLQSIHISRTLITDAALSHLETLPALRQVTLYGTWVTQEGADKLSAVLEAREPRGTVQGRFTGSPSK